MGPAVINREGFITWLEGHGISIGDTDTKVNYVARLEKQAGKLIETWTADDVFLADGQGERQKLHALKLYLVYRLTLLTEGEASRRLRGLLAAVELFCPSKSRWRPLVERQLREAGPARVGEPARGIPS